MPDVDIPCRPDYRYGLATLQFSRFLSVLHSSTCVEGVVWWYYPRHRHRQCHYHCSLFRDSEHCHHSHNLYSTLWIFEESIHNIHKVCVVLKIIQALLFFAVVEEGNGGVFASAVRWSAVDMKCVWPRRVP